NCTNVCSATVSAPVGSDTFAVNLYSAQNAGGSLLSTGTLTQSIIADQANSVNVTFNGVVASLSLALSAAQLSVGTPAAVTVTVRALDAAGNTIIGPGGYATATGAALTLALGDSDASGATTLSQTSLSAPPTSVITLNYNGTAIADPRITLSAGSLTPQNKTLGMTDTLNYTGTTQSLVVPSGVTTMQAVVKAGESGTGNGAYTLAGAAMTANLSVSAGSTLTVIVGNSAPLFPPGSYSAFGGGGSAGESFISGSAVFSGPGGGASAVFAASGPLVVAGAPGGADGDGISLGGPAGGYAGSASGVPFAGGTLFAGGNGGSDSGSSPGIGGLGGGTSGGTFGASATSGGCTAATTGTSATSSSVGVGGSGAACTSGNNYGGGGGGGGYTAGGGGGSGPNSSTNGNAPGGGGGGGGSSFVSGSASLVNIAASNFNAGSVVFTW
ncbi:MAG: hypothetical protein JO164_08865, partial [Candidatus Eremiobacteraeota bacterium]|nr:hypothetical protein [Candidatus Eremiobacteraeota bacterium]